MNKLLSHILYYLLRFLSLTYRFQFKGMESLKEAKGHHPKGIYIIGFWHQNIVSSALSHRGQKIIVMISASKDGELASGTAVKLGYEVVRGSSHRGGQRALKQMLRLLNDGHPAAITVDGPKGPAKTVKDGIVELARLKKMCILPLRLKTQKFWFFSKSWDQFRVPKPFTKIEVEYGNPILVPENLKREDFDGVKNSLANELNKDDYSMI